MVVKRPAAAHVDTAFRVDQPIMIYYFFPSEANIGTNSGDEWKLNIPIMNSIHPLR